MSASTPDPTPARFAWGSGRPVPVFAADGTLTPEIRQRSQGRYRTPWFPVAHLTRKLPQPVPRARQAAVACDGCEFAVVRHFERFVLGRPLSFLGAPADVVIAAGRNVGKAAAAFDAQGPATRTAAGEAIPPDVLAYREWVFTPVGVRVMGRYTIACREGRHTRPAIVDESDVAATLARVRVRRGAIVAP